MRKKEISQPVTTYTVKGRNTNTLWEFQYNLNGVLIQFKIFNDEVMSDKQLAWFLSKFPYLEKTILHWKEKVPNIEVIVGEPIIDFATFWNLYNYKVGKIKAEKEWKKLPKPDQIKAIAQIKAYNGFLRRKQIAKVYPERYLKHRRFEDQFNSIH